MPRGCEHECKRFMCDECPYRPLHIKTKYCVITRHGYNEFDGEAEFEKCSAMPVLPLHS